MEDVDLGVCRGQVFQGDPERFAVVLPGARYLPAAPLLWFAREALQALGWSVLQVWDEWDRSVEAHQWVDQRLEGGLREVGLVPTRLVVAKSLTTLALPAAVEQDLPGVWLTPLLNQEEVRGALADCTVPTLLVGGTGDPTWDSAFAAGLANVEVLEIPGADHGLQQPGDPTGSIDSLRIITERLRRFLEQIG